MNVRKIQIPKIEAQLEEIESEIAEAKAWLEAATYSIEYDENEYAEKEAFIKLWNIILTQLDGWERNFFIYDYKTPSSHTEKAQTIGLNPNSYRVYQCNLRKKIRKLWKQ